MLNDKEPVALNAAYALGRLGSAGIDELIHRISEGTTQIAQSAAYGLQGAGAKATRDCYRCWNTPMKSAGRSPYSYSA